MTFYKRMATCKRLAAGTVAALLMSGAAQAAGPYAGFSVGYQDIDVGFSESSAEFGDVRVDGLGGSGALFRAVVGYDSMNVAAPYLIGVEANIAQGGADAQVDADGLRTTLSAEESYGIAARFGGHVSDEVAAFGLLGYQRTSFEARTGVFSEDRNFDGLRLGAGADFRVAPQLDLRAQYARTWYNSRTFNDVKFDPEESTFEVGVIYRF
ncbi:porin family protein [Halomonas sp. Y3]|uniref:porin family protein n=1 Tax=Halomonas sp. Y3 TaxID=2956797 RepID=UPI0020A12C97|nr:porin family protein [Halomonas sp. Y3]